MSSVAKSYIRSAIFKVSYRIKKYSLQIFFILVRRTRLLAWWRSSCLLVLLHGSTTMNDLAAGGINQKKTEQLEPTGFGGSAESAQLWDCRPDRCGAKIPQMDDPMLLVATRQNHERCHTRCAVWQRRRQMAHGPNSAPLRPHPGTQ